jgi:hypothetical protein
MVPLAVFVPVHVACYATALLGARDYGVGTRDGLGLLFVLEVLLVWGPLAFHSALGARIALGPLEPELDERDRSVVLRITGALAALFVLVHAAWFELPLLSGERASEDLPELLAARLSSTVEGLPLNAAVHVLGLATVSVHVAVAVPRFFEKWGIGNVTVARRGARLASGILFAAGTATVIEFATGSAIPRFLTW